MQRTSSRPRGPGEATYRHGAPFRAPPFSAIVCPVDKTIAAASVFKVCGSCRHTWLTWEDFVTDPEVRLLGLQSPTTLPDATVLVFEHFCGSSVSILTRRLHHLVPDHPAVDWPSLRGTDKCPGHCFDRADRAPCDQRCRHALDRDILALITALRVARKRGLLRAPDWPPAL